MTKTIIYSIFILTFLKLSIAFCEEKPQQIITLITPDETINTGEIITIPVEYSVSNGDNRLNGLGIAILYDSSVLEYIDLKNYLELSIVDNPTFFVNISKESIHYIEDNDPNTDSLIKIAWYGMFSGGWPNVQLPVRLLDISFKVKYQNKVNTRINIHFTSTSAGFIGQSNTPEIMLNKILHGDCNNNNVIDMQDSLILLRLVGFE